MQIEFWRNKICYQSWLEVGIHKYGTNKDTESNLVDVGVHNKGADKDENEDGRETHFAIWGLPT